MKNQQLMNLEKRSTMNIKPDSFNPTGINECCKGTYKSETCQKVR